MSHVEAFVAELERLGMRLTALRLADGTLKVYRWRMRGAKENSQELEKLWSSTIGEDRARNDLLAEYILATEAKRDGASGTHIANKPRNDTRT
jgi:hypothetical protein